MESRKDQGSRGREGGGKEGGRKGRREGEKEGRREGRIEGFRQVRYRRIWFVFSSLSFSFF